MMTRKHALLAATLLTLSSFAFADANAPSLHNNMKSIKNLYKALVAEAGDSAKNAQGAKDAAAIGVLFVSVQSQVPDSISSLPADQQAAALADYKKLIGNEIDSAKSLEDAFKAGDNAKAQSILKDMDGTRKEGHGKYNQD